jgi:hypothetical protein
MFFAKALTSGFTSLFATHPALQDRIRRIEPSWDGSYPPARILEERPGDQKKQPVVDVAAIVSGAAVLAEAEEP